jgi:hypothetical protein
MATDVRTYDVQRFSNTPWDSEAFAKVSTLLLFATGYKSVDLIRSAWKRFVLIVQPLQFHYSLEDCANLNRVPLRLGISGADKGCLTLRNQLMSVIDLTSTTARSIVIGQKQHRTRLSSIRGSRLVNRTGDRGEYVIGIRTDQANRANHDHENHSQHHCIFRDVLTVLIVP